MNGKLQQWRNKTEREKHRLALTGAIAVTTVIALFWIAQVLASFGPAKADLTGLANNTAVASVAPASPVENIGDLAGEGWKQLKGIFGKK